MLGAWRNLWAALDSVKPTASRIGAVCALLRARASASGRVVSDERVSACTSRVSDSCQITPKADLRLGWPGGRGRQARRRRRSPANLPGLRRHNGDRHRQRSDALCLPRVRIHRGGDPPFSVRRATDGRRGLVATSARRRVVITGLGAVTPLGNDVRSSWENLVAGRAAADTITAFDTSGFPVTFACELKGFEPTPWIGAEATRGAGHEAGRGPATGTADARPRPLPSEQTRTPAADAGGLVLSQQTRPPHCGGFGLLRIALRGRTEPADGTSKPNQHGDRSSGPR